MMNKMNDIEGKWLVITMVLTLLLLFQTIFVLAAPRYAAVVNHDTKECAEVFICISEGRVDPPDNFFPIATMATDDNIDREGSSSPTTSPTNYFTLLIVGSILMVLGFIGFLGHHLRRSRDRPG